MRQPLSGRVVFQPAAYEGLQRGINQIVDAVRPTLGPRPRVVAIEKVNREDMPELLDNAGVIARRIIQLPDRDADMGAMLVRHLLWRLHEQVGDGTATAAVLFQSVYNQGLRYLAAGGNAMQLRRSLEKGVAPILDELAGMAHQLQGKEQLSQLAESLCFDPPLAALLGEIFDIIGEHGELEIRQGPRQELERQYVEGMYWKSGIQSPYMLADQIRLRTDLQNAAILITDREIDDPRDLMPVLDLAMEAETQALLIVANKLSDSAIAFLLGASQEPEKFRAIAAKTPGLGTLEQATAMEDLAVLAGGRPLLRIAGDALRAVKVADLGHARRVWVTEDHLGVVGGKGDPRALRAHIASLRGALERAEDGDRRGKLQERIGKLLGGSATLWIGGASVVDKEAREEVARRTADAMRGALREGVLIGGGISLLRCRSRLRRLLAASVDEDERTAYGILLRALEEPIRTIVANAGYDGGEVMAGVGHAPSGWGFDVRSGQLVDMAEAGIFDVASVHRAAVQGAITAAALALTVDVLVHPTNPEVTVSAP
jgi:chaperonin GroEL